MKFTISKDYSDVTGLRHCNISENSGEDFYHSKLNEVFYNAIHNKEKLELVLDGSLDGYGPSFLDEAIGNLVYDFTLDIVKENLEIISVQEAQWSVMINARTFPQWERRRIEKQEPIVTEKHSPWYRKIGDEYVKKEWATPNK